MNIVDYLSDLILMDRRELLKFSSTSPYRYKVYEIPKRNSNGKRTIAQPSKELKYIQRALLKFFDGVIPIHDSVFSYKKGISIKDNACCHVNYKYLLKMDFKDFFPVSLHQFFLMSLKSINCILMMMIKNCYQVCCFGKK
ncbi:hypothetical protein [Haemophilus pittmaniae]|uniref:hypothetical protein n=1 Tax=Haemophilus pittmaniae TaxID=249188 RepID=UPI000B94FAE1|nr:hypothetical protein [Haemophilus pittmaniae]SNV57733.1 reverse transcriptase [Haemophilus pittmaniae]